MFLICMETQMTLNSESNPEKEEWSWRNQAPWPQTTAQTYSNKNSMLLAQNRQVHQWNKIERPETNPHTHGQSIYDKGGKNTQWRKDSILNKQCRENWTAKRKRMKPEHSRTPYPKINYKWTKDPNVRLDTTKLPEENIGRTLPDINHSKISFDPSLVTCDEEGGFDFTVCFFFGCTWS